MLAIVTARRGTRAAGRFVTLSLMLALVAGCKARDTSGAGKPTNPHSWAPDKLTSIQDVPAKEIETLIQKKLDGPRPGRNSGAAENRQRLSEGVT